MEPTTTGMNKTGIAANPDRAQAMAQAVQSFSPPTEIDTSAADQERLFYVAESQALGSIPRPASLIGTVKTGMAQLMGERPELLMDKVGERMAFERSGVRLYDALIVKYMALAEAGIVLPKAAQSLQAAGDGQGGAVAALELDSEEPGETLERIRSEELEHFHMLSEVMQQLGGDPTAQTPAADVIGTASAGIVQVVTDPRTTFGQSLNAILTIELVDNAGWELLIQLATRAGKEALSERFAHALAQEAQHLLIIRGWHSALLLAEDTSPAL
ncbi:MULTISPECIES: ferritin-like domain-containing protein [unclassified Acidovorax]|uniref:ferritin-like domain-containing protein n=1 Tax=unclassified Acidovorax TaxID=2684926 RepID=UPI002882F919|nr:MULTISPECIES: ferritin-like domain-containing protein [unclassified Acidovorax]